MEHLSNLHPIEAEQAIISAVIANNDIWSYVLENLDKSDFCKKEHQVLFDMMTFLISKNEPVDKITLINLLKKNSHLENLSGNEFINSLIKNTPSIKNLASYIEIVKNKSTLRRVIEAGKDIIDFSINHKNESINEILNFAEDKIAQISKKINKKDDFKNIQKVLLDTLKNIEIRNELKSNITGIPSGFKELDDLTAGFHKSDLIVIAGRPSMGKSTLAINIAEHIIINNKKPVVIFSMEMPVEQIITRLISSLGRINLHKLRSGILDQSDWPRLLNSASLLIGKNLFIDDNGALTPFDIKNKIKKIEKDIKDIGLIIIDYIQLIKIPGLQDSRAREIAEISRSLKILAKEFNVPIIVLSQLNRSLELRNDKRPLMSDLRESGAIEQDADLIVFIYRDEVYNKNERADKISEIIIAKQRNGPIGKINLKFLPEYCKFENLK